MGVELTGPWWAWVLLGIGYLLLQGYLSVQFALAAMRTVAQWAREENQRHQQDELAARRG